MKVMSGLDARFLSSESPSVHMHTIKVAIVDVSRRSEPLTAEGLLTELAQRLDRMPVLRRRIVPVPRGLGNPVVIDDPDFDLRRHIRHATVAPPGGARQLDEVIAEIAAVPLPRDRPLWELTVVDGLDSSEIAFVVKIHHALADGVAAVALLTNAFVLDDGEAVTEPYRPVPVPSNQALLASSAVMVGRAFGAIPGFVGDTVAGLKRRRAAHRLEEGRVVGPFAGPRSPFNVSLTPERTFATLSLPIDAMARARRAAGASLNDVFLAVCGGGVRRHLRRSGDLPRTSLVASVPVATRTDRQRLHGNHVDNLFLPLHTDLADPIARIRAIHDSVSSARRSRAALGQGLFERRAGLVPPILNAATTRAWAATGLANRVRPPLNLVASSVPGPRAPLELDGGLVTALYSSGPILEGIGLNITAWSYVDTMGVSLIGCPDSLPDPWALAADMATELEEMGS